MQNLHTTLFFFAPTVFSAAPDSRLQLAAAGDAFLERMMLLDRFVKKHMNRTNVGSSSSSSHAQIDALGSFSRPCMYAMIVLSSLLASAPYF